MALPLFFVHVSSKGHFKAGPKLQILYDTILVE